MSNDRFTLEDLALYPTLMWDPEVRREVFSRPGTSDQIVHVEFQSSVFTHGDAPVEYSSKDFTLPLGVIEHGIENVGFRAKVMKALSARSRVSQPVLLPCSHCGQNTNLRQSCPSGLGEVANGRVRCSIVGAACCNQGECEMAVVRRLHQTLEDTSRKRGDRTLHPDAYHVFCSSCQKYEEQVGSFKKCSRCRCTYFCDKDCQKSHWRIHKQICKPCKK